MSRVLFALVLVVALPASGIEITSFSPGAVTIGTELTILGDFAEVVAAGGQPRVFGVRADTKRRVAFEVLTVSSTEIHAVATRFPSSKTAPAADQEWNLVVLSPKGSGAPAEAPDTFISVAPELVAVGGSWGIPGAMLELLVDDAGAGKLTVRFGEKRAKQLLPTTPSMRVAAAPASRTSTFVKVPKLEISTYQISVENEVGASAGTIPFDVVGLPLTPLCSSMNATISGRPDYGGSASFDLTGASGIHSCGPGCTRTIDVAIESAALDNAIANPFQRSFVPATVSYTENGADQWTSGDVQVSMFALVVVVGSEVVVAMEGNFFATLEAVDPNVDAPVVIAGSFCAMSSPAAP